MRKQWPLLSASISMNLLFYSLLGPPFSRVLGPTGLQWGKRDFFLQGNTLFSSKCYEVIQNCIYWNSEKKFGNDCLACIAGPLCNYWRGALEWPSYCVTSATQLFHALDLISVHSCLTYEIVEQLIPLLAKTKLNSMVWVREQTIPTEWPPLVGEVIANFCG
jgi:hypothetical protein